MTGKNVFETLAAMRELQARTGKEFSVQRQSMMMIESEMERSITQLEAIMGIKRYSDPADVPLPVFTPSGPMPVTASGT
jgi:hypothetical protein